jgi:plastocyanin
MKSQLSKKSLKRRWVSIVMAAVLCVVTSLALVTPTASADTYTIKMGSDSGNLVFQPATLTVKRGDVIQWVNNKLPPHNVMFDASKAPAENAKMLAALSHSQLMIKPDENYVLTISDDLPPGEYNYYCAPHRGAGMVAKIIVEG